MRIPSEYFVRYLAYLGKSSEDILASLRDKLLIKNLPKSDIDLRVARFWDLVNNIPAAGKSLDDIVRDLGIFELVDHHVNGNINPDVFRAYTIIAYAPARKMIEQMLIVRMPYQGIVDRLREECGFDTTEEAIRIYSHYFCLDNLSHYDWYTFLRSNDVFGHSVLFDDIPTASLHRDRILRQQKAQAEFEYIAQSAFGRLQRELTQEESSPDMCSKWYKIFESSRTKATAITAPKDTPGAQDDSMPKFEIGFGDLPETRLRSADEFVSPKKEETSGG